MLAGADTQALAPRIATIPTPDLVVFLRQFDKQRRAQLVAELLAAGADQTKLAEALRDVEALDNLRHERAWRTLLLLLGIASGTISAFHGYRRTQRLAPTVGWFAAGFIVPPITLTVAVAQGFAKPRR